MTTEETELTFMRCPSCRSLVPTMATKCRMCGHVFEESSSKSIDYGEPQRKSRVRQRTVSVSPEEVEDITEQIFADRANSEATGFSHSKKSEAYGEVGIAIEESDSPIGKATQHDSEANNNVVDFNDPREFVPQASDEQPFLAERADTVSGEQKSSISVEEYFGLTKNSPEDSDFESANIVSDSDDSNYDDGIDELEPGDDESEDGEREISQGAGDEEAKPGGKRKRRRRRRRRRDTGSTLASSIEEKEPDSAIASELGTSQNVSEVAQEIESSVESAENEQVSVSIQDQLDVSSPSPEYVSEKVETSKEGYMATQEIGMEHESVGKNSKPTSSPRQSSTDRQKIENSESGHLVGWLVSYSQSQRGAGTELRSGRFFIGRQQLRADDLVIADTAISTPHCLISAIPGDGVKIQDLMSEQGTFVKRKGTSTFERIQDVVDVEHGDTLRFGAYEVLVCLVP